MSESPLDERAIERRILLRATAVAAAFFFVIIFVNASSLTTDAMRIGHAIDPRVPWLLELTSILVIVGLIPLIALYERRLPFDPDSLPLFAVGHIAGSVVFSALHVAGMIALRHVAYPLVLGQPYAFFDEPVSDLLYEYRKDLLAYSMTVLVLTLMRGVEEHRREAAVARLDARDTGRLTLKSGGRTIFLDARSIEWAQAAANYSEIRANGRTHLARISLAALEEQLSAAGIDAVRIHRSYLVNRAKVTEIAPSRDGDFRVRTADGSELRGSRRYRGNLEPEKTN
jgi:hypothetical protein